MGMCEKEIFCHVGNSVYLCIPKEKKDGNTLRITMADKFEDKIQKALYQYLLKTNEVDEHLPENRLISNRIEISRLSTSILFARISVQRSFKPTSVIFIISPLKFAITYTRAST